MKLHLRLIQFIGRLIVLRRLRAGWRQEWEAACIRANCCWLIGATLVGEPN